MQCSAPGSPVPHDLPESAQIHVLWVGDAVKPSHPLSTASQTQICYTDLHPLPVSPHFTSFFLPLELGISFSPKCPCRWRSKCFPLLHPRSGLNGISGSHGPWVVRTALWTPFRSGHVNDHTTVRSELWQGYFCLALYSTLMLLSPKVTRGWGWLVGVGSIVCKLKQNPASSQCWRESYGDPD